MKIFLIIVLPLLLTSCSSESNDSCNPLTSCLLSDNEVSGWVENTDIGQAGPQQTSDRSFIANELSFNGAIEHIPSNMVALAYENYKNGAAEANVYLLEAPNAASGKTMYENLENYLKDFDETNLALGDGGRVMRAGLYVFIEAYKGKFVAQVRVKPEAQEQAANDIISAIFAKIQ
jgi:hypothetical protein